jgi:hypothetical protein
MGKRVKATLPDLMDANEMKGGLGGGVMQRRDMELQRSTNIVCHRCWPAQQIANPNL